MATIPYINEPQQRLKALNAPGFRNTATVENLARGEVELAAQFGVAADKLQDYVIAKQNQLDLTRVQNASSAWKEYEFQRKRYMLNKKGTNAENALQNETLHWDHFRDRMSAQDMGDPFAESSVVFRQRRTEIVDGVKKYIPSGYEPNPNYRQPDPEDMAFRSNLEKLKSKFNDIYDSMDERQKIATDEIINNRRPAYLHAIGTHEDNERIKAMVAANEQGIKWAATEAINATTQPERDKKILEGETMIRANLHALGQDKNKKDVNIQLQVFRSAVHNGVIDDMLNQPSNQTHHLKEAEAYKKAHEGEINLKTRKLINKKLYDHRVVVKSNQLALEISQLPDDEQFGVLSSIKDKEIMEKTMSKLFQLQSMARRSKTRQDLDNTNAVYDWLQTNKGMVNGKPIDLNAITGPENAKIKTAYNALPSAKKEQLKLIQNGLIEGDKPIPERLDLETADAVTRMVTEDKEKFLKANLAVDYYGKMKPERISTFMTLQRTMREEDAKGDGENSIVKYTQQIAARMNKLGWTGDDYARHRGRTQERIMAKIIEHRTNSNTDPTKRTNPTDAEVQQFIKDVVTIPYVTETNNKYPIAADPLTDEIPNDKRVTAFIQQRGWTTKKHLKKIGAFKQGVINATDKWMENPDNRGKKPDEFDMADIIRTVGEDEIHQDVSFWLDDDLLYTEYEQNPTKYKFEKLFVTLANGDKVFLDKHLGSMPAKERKEIGAWLTTNGFRKTYKNVGEAWRERHPDIKLNKAMPKDGPIPNPGGGKTVSVLDLESSVEKAEGNYKDMLAARPDINKLYGTNALQVYDRLIAPYRTKKYE